MIFIDSNVVMYAAGHDHPLKQPALSIIAKIETGELEAVSSVEVLQEILYRYWSIGKLVKGCQVFTCFESLIPRILPVNREDLLLAKDYLINHSKINPRDALHAAVMKNNKIKTIISADKDFDLIPGIKRKDLVPPK